MSNPVGRYVRFVTVFLRYAELSYKPRSTRLLYINANCCQPIFAATQNLYRPLFMNQHNHYAPRIMCIWRTLTSEECVHSGGNLTTSTLPPAPEKEVTKTVKWSLDTSDCDVLPQYSLHSDQ